MNKLLKLLDDILNECPDSAATQQLVCMRKALVFLSKRKDVSHPPTTCYETAFSHLAYKMEELRSTDLEEICCELESPHDYDEDE